MESGVSMHRRERGLRARLRRLSAALASVAVVATGLVVLDAPDASALTLAAPSVVYQADVNGDYILVGNGVLRWNGAAVTGAPTEDQLHNGAAGAYYNDYVVMGNNTVATLPTAVNGSSATLTVPAGARIARAQLSWAANLGEVNGRPGAYCSSNGAATLPASGSASTQALQLKVGADTPRSVTPGAFYAESVAAVPATNPNYYSASQDVTAIFQNAIGVSSGAVQTVSVGDIWAPTGAGCFAGWSLTVVYDFGQLIAGNAASTGRTVVLYSGHVRQATTDPAVTIDFDSFETLDSSSRVGVTLYEGDRNITGDTVSWRAGTTGGFTPLSNLSGINTTNNYGISVADGSVRYAGNGTNTFFNASVDARSQTIPLPTGTTSMQLRMATNGDSYLWQNAVLSTASAHVSINKAALDGTDTQAVNPGGTPTFRITVSNNGSTSLGSFAITDALAPNCARPAGSAGLPTTLASAASFSYTCTGPVTSTGWTNSATVNAVAGGGSNRAVTSTDTTVVTVTRIGLTKSGTVPANATAGQPVTYTFTATNTGTSPLSGVTITDPKPGLSTITYGTWPSGTAGVLGPGQSVTATATYPLTQADINSGTVTNTASVAASGPNGTSASATAPATVSVSANPQLTLAKSGVLNPGGTAITYSFTVSNVGNLPLTGVAISDPMLTAGSIIYGAWPSGTAGTLAPGQSVTATATYPVTQANTNAGTVANTATVTGTPPRGSAPTATANATVPIPRNPAIVTTKSGALAVTGVAPRVGDLVTYTFTARNSGNTTLTGVTIADPMPGLSALTYTWPGTAGTLQPGQTVTATATYALTQANIDAGSVVNTATSRGTSPTGEVTGPATNTLPLTRAPAIALTKSGSIGGTGVAGDVVTYSFAATNTGNTTLTGVAIADPLPGLSALTYTWPGTAGTLLPGQTVTATATRALTQADVNSGSVVNSATASGTAPGGASVTATRPATVPIPQGPAIRLTKTGALSGASGAGGTVTFTFVVRNTGNVTLSGVGVTDQLSGLSAITFGTWPGTTGSLDPGQSVTGTATYTVTQADADRGSVTNNATARGTSAQGTTVTGTAGVTVPIAASPAITLDKTGTLNGTGKAGDTITYTFSVRNSGSVTLTGVTVNDPKVGGAVSLTGWPGAAGVLAPGQSATGTATHTLTQAEVNAGVVNNTASAAGTPPAGGSVSTTDSASVVIPAAPAIQLVKSASPATANRAGDVITYSFTVTNRGNVTLTGVGVTDPLAGLGAITFGAWPGGVAGTLQPNASVTATATYTVKQSDVDAGSLVNAASTTGTPPVGPAVTATDPEVVPIPRNPAMTFVKTGALTGTGQVGDTVTYSFRVTNSGNVTLTGVGITDPLPGLSPIAFGAWPGATGTLLPGQFVQATATYSLTQADVDRGRVDNLATAAGNPPSGPQITRTDDATVSVTASPAIEIVKEGTRAGGATPVVGDIVTYTFDVTNRGNVTLDEITVTDPKPGLSTITFGAWPGTAGELAPGATVRATATYTLTQADVDAGTTTNTATARGVAPSGTAVTDADGADVPLTAAPAIHLEKDGVLAGDAVAGDEVTYTFVLSNTGNVTLSAVNLRDPLLSANPLPITGWPGTAGQLRPGQSVTVTAQHVLTQADIDAGSIVNTATAAGTPPHGAAVSDADSATVTLAPEPEITLGKTVRPIAAATAGTVVTYDFTIVNTGTVTLTSVAITDALPGIGALTYQWPGTAGVLAPGAQARATATYTLTQADVDAGSLVNQASVSGTPPTGAAVTDDDDAPLALAPTPSLDLTKSHTVSGSGVVGDVITYRFTLHNTGNVTLTGVTASDPLVGLSPLVFPGGWDGVLSPGEVVVATATYTLTQADVDAGSVVNTASASGTPPTGGPVSDTGADTVTMPFGPAITLEKTGTAAGASVGDVVTYTFEIRNSGNLTLSNVTLDDPTLGGPLTITGWPGTPGTLAPAEVATATATYTLTQADADAGSVSNTATTTGTTPGGELMTDSDDVVVPLAAEPAISVTKSGVLANGATGVAGDIVTYTFTVRNTGNVTLTGVDVTDPLAGLSTITFPASWPSGTAGVLAPGESVQATATYALTQTDANRGYVDNTATATGTPPTGADVVDTGNTRVVIAAAPRLQVVKTGVLSAGPPAAGSTISYTFQLANLGNVTLTGITLDDGLAAIGTVAVTWPGAAGTLQPGQTATGTATYTVTQADLDSGSVVNTASASGTPPVGPPVAGSDIETVALSALPSIELVKSASGVVSAAGDEVTYDFVVRNTGNVTLTDVALVDPLLGGAVTLDWSGVTEGELAPGAEVTGSATYALSQADVDAGSVVNTASVSGTPPTGADVTDQDDATVTVTSAPALTATKSGALQGPAVAGTAIQYTFTVRNTGNVTLTGVGLQDFMPGLTGLTFGTWPGAVGELEPGESVGATATYTLTQADVDAGAVVNSALASGETPSGASVTAPAAATVPVPSGAGIQIVKTGSLPGAAVDGGSASYTFTVRNTGNVTLTGVTVDDPLLGGPIALDWTGLTAGELAPGGVVSGTATYTLTQADVDAGEVRNTASVSGTPPTGSDVTDTDAVTIPLTAAPAIDVEKTGSLTGASVAGGTVSYGFTVRNAGNVTLTGVAVTDPLLGGPVALDWTGLTEGELAPGDVVTGTATYTLTQAQVDAGVVTNTASVAGTSPTGVSVTDSDTVGVTLTRAPGITIDKTGALDGDAVAGDTVSFDFSVRNTGNVTLTGVAVTDPLLGGAVTLDWTGHTVGELAPGDTVTGTATYTLTQADVDAGEVENSAAVAGTPPTGSPVTGTDTVTVPLAPAPAIAVDKTGTLTGPAVAGGTVTYNFTVRNTGTVTLTAVTLSDPLVGGAVALDWTGLTAGELAPGASVSGTATYTLTQANVDAGSVANTATAVGTPPTGSPVTGTDTAVVAIASAPGIELAKTGALDGSAIAGGTIEYGFVVRNTGTVTLTGVAVTDPLLGGAVALDWTGLNAGELAPGATVSGTARYTLTQADVDAGEVANTASVSGTPPTGAAVTDTDSALVVLPEAPAIAITKNGALQGPAVEGTEVRYEFVVRNTGNVTLTGVGIVDLLPGLSGLTFVAWPGSVGVLAPDESVTATATYTLTQADVDAGSVVNTANASAESPTGTPVRAPSTATVLLPSGAGLQLEKSGTISGQADAGDPVTYSFTVRNTGNVTLTGVTVTDPLLGGPVALDWTGLTEGELAPGAVVTGSATYTMTQADVDAGNVPNTATATGTPPTGDDVTADDSVNVVLRAAPAVTVEKTGTLNGAAVAGGTVTYGFTVTNTGNVTLTGVAVTDPLLGGPVALDWTGLTEGELAPGATVSGSATYTLTQADIDAGSVANTASVSGTPPTGSPVTGTDTVTVSMAPAPGITVEKTGTLNGAAVAGGTVTYGFTVTNTGNVTLTGVSVADPLLGGPVALDWTGLTEGELAPGATVSGSATYTLTQADVDAGSVANTASVSGTPPTGGPVTGTDTVTVSLAPAPGISVEKTGTLNGAAVAGGTVTYAFTVTNTGNVTLTGVAVTDPLLGGAVALDSTGLTEGELAPGATVSGSATYTLTQADIDAGSVANTASVSGTPPTGSAVTDTDSATVTLTPAPGIQLVKLGALSGTGVAGDTITYTFEITNVGTVTLTGVALTDPMTGLSAIDFGDWPSTSGVLAPSQSVTATATYTVTQDDVDAGEVENTASATGTPPTGEPVADTDAETVPMSSEPAITLEKQATAPAAPVAGDAVTYSFTVRNSGNVTLSGIQLADALPGLSTIVYGPWPGADGVLRPGEQVTATASYPLTQADLDRGTVENTASVTGEPATCADPDGCTVTSTDSATATLATTTSMDLVKTGELSSSGNTSVVTFTFVATNTGTTTMTGVEIADPLPGLSALTYGTWPGEPGVLAPGQSIRATATYTLTQADFEAGTVVNSATVTGLSGGGITVTSNASTSVPVVPTPALTIDKSVDRAGAAGPGTTLTYRFVVVNTGNVTLTGLQITDPLPGLSGITYAAWPQTVGVLAPGESVTATATYVVSAADGARGTIINTATATASAANGVTATATDTVTTSTVPLPNTGGVLNPAFPIGALLMILLGLAALRAGRRKETA